MDPLTASSSIIAIVSLALELGQSAVRTKRFLDDIRNIPVEVTGLQESIHQIRTISDGIRTLLDLQKTSYSQDSYIYDNIYHAMRTCKDKVDLIREVLQIADQVTHGRPGLSRTWTQFRLVCRKEQIQDLEKQLQQSVTILVTSLLLNIMRVTPP